jgi:hypothetical protein
MQVLTKDDAAEVTHRDGLDFWLHEQSMRLKPAGAAYAIPPQSRAQTALAKFLACLLLQGSSVYVYLSRWSLHPASEHLNLFYGYRRSVGETRPLSEAPVHFFDPAAREELISILCLLFYFGWDAWIFDREGKMLIRSTRAAGLEVLSDGTADIGAFAADPARYFMPLAS